MKAYIFMSSTVQPGYLTSGLLEDDYNMYNTNSVGYAANHYFDSEAGVNYMIVITLFAENDAGRDTITRTYYVTGK